MFKNLGKTLVLTGLAAFCLAEAASATLYVSRRYCGGNAFATCAAIQLDVTGTTVTLRVWNLSGNTAGTYGTPTSAYSAFNGIGVYNIPPAVDIIGGSMTTSGITKAGNSAPSSWVLRNNGTVGFLLDFAATPQPGVSPFSNNIVSGCAPLSQTPNARMYTNSCIDPSSGSMADWVTFQFQVNQTWDATNAAFVFRATNTQTLQGTECWTADAPNGSAQNCYTVTPEPLTMTLLATGLIGLGGVGYLRRRKQKDA